MPEALRGWTATQKHVVAASYLAWMLDAFDYFLLTFVLRDIAAEFQVKVSVIAVALVATLALRPLGAFLFGRLADRYGRRPVLAINIAVYSLLSFSTAFVPNIWVFWIVRGLFGIGMGGIWGIGASLAFETVKPQARGFLSGLMQSGYPMGNLLATLVFWLFYAHVGWRGMFMVGIIPSLLLIPYVLAKVPESPVFDREKAAQGSTLAVLRDHWKLALFAILLMTGYNFFSHGTQDLYPTFLQKQHGFPVGTVTFIVTMGTLGALIGSFTFGSLSQHFGRRNTITTAALCGIPVVALWAFAPTAPLLALGAFLMQICVQGAWGVVPAHLNELSPAQARGTFAGTVYQLGNLIASVNGTLQPIIAERTGGNYSLALAAVAIGAALVIATVARLGPEAHGVEMKA